MLISEVDPWLAHPTLEFYAQITRAKQADHVRIALESGLEVQHILDAHSATVPMTGVVTLQIGARAALLAQSDGTSKA